MPLLYGSLFSGIGGIDLGFDRAGLKCAWQVEIDPFARKVLEKHWPEVPKHDDIRTFKPTPVDVVCGGFPCQDISSAGTGKGLQGKRSGLWYEFERVIREIRPRFVVVENVAVLLNRGFDEILGTLAAVGYDAEWNVIPAFAVGAPHVRERLFIVAWNVAHSEGDGRNEGHSHARGCGTGIETWKEYRPRRGDRWWQAEPAVGRVANGIPDRVDRLRGLGNAVVPDIAEWIGRRLIESV